MWRNDHGRVFVTDEIINEVKTSPVSKQLEHCGQKFSSGYLSFYATCPKCETRIKLRSFSANPELEDLFDAFIEWSLKPGAAEMIKERREAIVEDNDD
ncbi:hypothetical protein BH10ACI2_BH10ACI2_16220 [soil metagenome]